MFEGAASADWATSAFPCEPIITSSAPPMTQRCPGQESNLHARREAWSLKPPCIPFHHLDVSSQKQKPCRGQESNLQCREATWSEHAVYPVPPPRQRCHLCALEPGSRALLSLIGSRTRSVREHSFSHRHDRARTCVVSAPNGVPASTRLRAKRTLLRVGSNHHGLPHEGSCSPTSRSSDVFAWSRTRISSFGGSRVVLFTTKTDTPGRSRTCTLSVRSRALGPSSSWGRES